MTNGAGARNRVTALLVLKSVLFGAIGFVVVPIVVFILVLGLAHLFDPACGTPGDSGGCEMGSATAAFASAIPGFALLFFVTFIRGLRRPPPVFRVSGDPDGPPSTD